MRFLFLIVLLSFLHGYYVLSVDVLKDQASKKTPVPPSYLNLSSKNCLEDSDVNVGTCLECVGDVIVDTEDGRIIVGDKVMQNQQYIPCKVITGSLLIHNGTATTHTIRGQSERTVLTVLLSQITSRVDNDIHIDAIKTPDSLSILLSQYHQSYLGKKNRTVRIVLVVKNSNRTRLLLLLLLEALFL